MFLATGRSPVRACHKIATLNCCIFESHMNALVPFSIFSGISDMKIDLEVRVLLKCNFSIFWPA